MSASRTLASMAQAWPPLLLLLLVAAFMIVLTPVPARDVDRRQDLTGLPVMVYESTADDTLLDIARRFDLGFVELVAANPGVDPWLPGVATPITLPLRHILPAATREGIVINLAELRLYSFERGRVRTYPIGIGSSGRETRTGRTLVRRRRVDPVWTPPQSVRAEHPELPSSVPPGDDNPMGRFALDLDWPSYAIHGTNRPWGVGRRVSHGCIRLYPEDIEQLFASVRAGTPVTVVDQPVKLGWAGAELFLEVHPRQAEADVIEEDGAIPSPEGSDIPDSLRAMVLAAAGRQADLIDWNEVSQAVSRRRGIPVPVLRAPGGSAVASSDAGTGLLP